MKTDDNKNFRDFFNRIDDFLFVLDLNGNIIETNNTVLNTLGYTREELIGSSVLMVHPSEFRDQAREIIIEMVKGEQESCPLPLITKSKTYIPVETKVYAGKWSNQDVLFAFSRNLSALTLSENKFREVFNNTLALMAISEIDTGLILNINKQFCKTLGYSENELLGKTAKELNLYHDYNQRISMIQKLRDVDKVENEEIVFRTKRGELIHCLLSISRIWIEDKPYMLTAANDVTQIKVSEERLKRSLRQETVLADISKSLNNIHDISGKLEETLALLVKHTNVSRIYIFEEDSKSRTTSNTYEWCNNGIRSQKHTLQKVPFKTSSSWKKLLEKEGKIQSNNTAELPEDIFIAVKHFGAKSLLAFPIYIKDKLYGTIGFDECNFYRKWEQDEVELLRAISNIISNTFERIRIQEQLSKSEEQLKTAMENTDTGLWDWHIPSGKVYYSKTWCKMIGYRQKEIRQHIETWTDLVHPEDYPGIKKILDDHLAGKSKIYEAYFRLKTKSGDWKWILAKGKVTERDRNGNPIRAIGTHTDIDKQKKIESELRAANATKDKFFSIIAHDLRDPIGSMMHISELLSDKPDIDEKLLYTFLESQKEISRYTFQLLDNLLNWAKYNRDQMEYHPKPIIINEIIDTCINNFRFKAENKGITINTGFKEIYNAFADEEMIKLIFRNLLSNAIKFTARNGEICFNLSTLKEFVKISISDTGVGISKKEITSILSEDRYYTSYGTENEKGSGLGLKLCRDFVAINHGKFIIESQPLKGTTITFTLPITNKTFSN